MRKRNKLFYPFASINSTIRMELADKICDYASQQHTIKQDSIEEIKKRIADSIFVAHTARNAKPIMISKAELLPSSGKYNSRIYFSKNRASADVAAFINGSMTRYMDYNDTYLSKEAIHPSDNIAPMFSISDAVGSSGKDTIKAIWLSYQIACSLADAGSVRDRGWDHVVYISISAAAGLAKLLGLNSDKFKNALALAINNSVSMRQTRVGKLSMWKGCTVGDAARGSVFAAILAKGGLTGPSPIFEGDMGFFKQVSGKLDVTFAKEMVPLTMVKAYPVEYHAMSGVEAALSLKKQLNGKIERINVETFKVGYDIIVKGPEKLKPQNKETADHSLPYIIAYSLIYGQPTYNSYSEKFLKDKRILYLIGRMSIKTSKRFDSMYPKYTPIKISVKTGNGYISEEVKVQKGHPENPFTWDDIKAKGMACIGDESIVGEIIKIAKSFEKRDASDMLEAISNVDTKR
ncbi:MAG: MmgE/PrpD family protein [Candidatus Micrarchaeaceae archaeon]